MELIFRQIIRHSLLLSIGAGLGIYFFGALVSTVAILATVLVAAVKRAHDGKSTIFAWLLLGLTSFALQLIAGVFFIEHVGSSYVHYALGVVLFVFVCLICSLPFVASGLVLDHFVRKGKIFAGLAFFSALFPLLDFLRSNTLLMAGGSLAYSSLDGGAIPSWLISVGGEFFLVLAISLTASVLALAILKGSLRYALLISFTLISTMFLQPNNIRADGKEITVHLIQPGISSREKYEDQAAIREHLSSIVRDVASSTTEEDGLIVLPESIFVTTGDEDSDAVMSEIRQAADGHAVIYGEMILGAGDSNINRAVLIDRHGKSHIYFKQGLILFGEYMPAPVKYILGIFGIDLKSVEKSDFASKIGLDKDAGLIVSLCYEQTESDTLRSQMRSGLPSMIVSLSDYSWVKNSRIYEFTRSATRIRAIEYGVPLVQAGVDRATFFIDANGRVISESKSTTGYHEVMTSTVNIAAPNTVYYRDGDSIFLFLSSTILMFCFFLIRKTGDVR